MIIGLLNKTLRDGEIINNVAMNQKLSMRINPVLQEFLPVKPCFRKSPSFQPSFSLWFNLIDWRGGAADALSGGRHENVTASRQDVDSNCFEFQVARATKSEVNPD